MSITPDPLGSGPPAPRRRRAPFASGSATPGPPAPGSATPGPSAPERRGCLDRVFPVGVLLAVMWILEIVDVATPLNLDQFGIRPLDTAFLIGILISPVLHLGFDHLISNTMALVVLGPLVALTTKRFWLVTAVVVLLGGIGVWLTGGPGTIHIGASGIVYGYAAFLVTHGFASRHPGRAVVGIIVALVYGGMVWGVLPIHAGVSWQAHLWGAVAGVAIAIYLGRRERRRSAPPPPRLRP